MISAVGDCFRSAVSDEGVFGVRICPTARDRRCKGFDGFSVGFCCEVSIKRAGVSEMGEFSGISVASGPVSSISVELSELSGLGVAGSISGLFSGRSDDLRVRTTSALCSRGHCCFSKSYLITLQLSSVATFTSLCLWPEGISELQVIDWVVLSLVEPTELDSPGMTFKSNSGVLFVYGYSG